MLCFLPFVHTLVLFVFITIALKFLYFDYKRRQLNSKKKNIRYNLDSNIDLKIVTVSYSEIISAKLIIGLIFINIWLQRPFSLSTT